MKNNMLWKLAYERAEKFGLSEAVAEAQRSGANALDAMQDWDLLYPHELEEIVNLGGEAYIRAQRYMRFDNEEHFQEVGEKEGKT